MKTAPINLIESLQQLFDFRAEIVERDSPLTSVRTATQKPKANITKIRAIAKHYGE